MRTSFGKPSPPSEDRRWKMIGATMRRYGYQSHALIETLHTVQESFGYIDENAFHYVANSLRIPLSHVYGVATFYHFFNLKPQGEHSCVVCTGTACYIKGASSILKAIEEEYEVKAGETTEDGQLSVLTARCIGTCSIAPAAVFDGEIIGYLTPNDAVNRIRRCIEQ